MFGSEVGDIKPWDVREMSSDPVRSIKLQRTGGISRLDVHSTLAIIAW